jgi:hypothetical protein
MVAANQATNYLHRCFHSFRDVIERKYPGRAFDLPAIERSVKHLRRETPLSYLDLAQFESPKHWWFEKFWVFPPEHQISPHLKRRKFNFWALPNREPDVITLLYEVFRSIELVSIILRFIKPEDYGIISPPVERVLDVRLESDAIETYLNYLSDLRTIKKHYGFKRVADADMALWVVHEKCYGEPKDTEIVKAYHGDSFLLELRAKNLMDHFFDQYTYADLARALARFKPKLAAQIGGIAFEQMVRERASVFGDHYVDKELQTLIDDLWTDGAIDDLTKGRWHKARRVRNRVLHDKDNPSHNDLESLLKLLP